MTPSAIDEERREHLCRHLLRPLNDGFAAAAEAYADYLQNGKSFRAACMLRRINGTARELLAEHGGLLPAELQGHAAALMHHYDVWSALWDELAEANKPAPEDAFVFENAVRFPKESQQAFRDACKRLCR